MSDAEYEVLSALLDREPVDPDALARTLDRPEGRRTLVDFVRVRHAMAADRDEPALVQAPPRPSSRATLRALRAVAAIALLALAAAGGAWTHAELTKERPPEPDRIVRFQPGVDWR